jgi:hydroxymethylpyrimidine pyrophosphatase-like HAD family hydrolase
MSDPANIPTAPLSGSVQQPCSLVVAFDIDGTWSLDPALFKHLAYTFQKSGWRVIIVTGAEQPAEKLQRLMLTGYPLIVSGGQFKEHAARKAGYEVAVWIDDMPGMIQDCRILSGDL